MFKYILFLLFVISFNACAGDNETIDIRYLVVDTLGKTSSDQQKISAALNAYTNTLNEYFTNSQVALTAEVVDISFIPIESDHAEIILQNMQEEREGFANMFSDARRLGADYTFAITQHLLIQGQSRCGRAIAVNQSIAAISSTRSAFAVVNFACGAHTIAHELGHLMGLNHGDLVNRCDPNHGHSNALTPYAKGFGEGNCDGIFQPGEFGDIMIGGWMTTISGKGKKNLPIYSNPRITDERCGQQHRCGDPENGDAARTLNEYAKYYSGHETKP